MTKKELFDKLKNRGVFWSYSKDITYKEAGDELFLEYLFKYGDFDDLVWAFKLYDKEYLKKVWQKKLQDDKRFIKLNVIIARVFFGMDVDGSYFKKAKNARFEKLKMLAS
jgi:hypothetical protein